MLLSQPAVFRLAVGTLSVALVVVSMLAFVQGPQSAAAYLFFAYAFAMAANAVLPHLAATLVLRRYMPGTATGLLLNLPLGVVLLREGVNEGWVSLTTLLWVAPACAVALLSRFRVLFAPWVAKLLSRLDGRPDPFHEGAFPA